MPPWSWPAYSGVANFFHPPVLKGSAPVSRLSLLPKVGVASLIWRLSNRGKKMNWGHLFLFSCFTAFLLLIVLDGKHNIVKAATRGRAIPDLKKKLFVQKLDASNFLKKREQRFTRYRKEFDDKTNYESREPEYEKFTAENEDWDERSPERDWDERSPEREWDD